jgi:hypothetical protein
MTIQAQLTRIATDCREPNWDGEQAAAINRETVALAGYVAAALPELHLDDAVPCPSGSVVLENLDGAIQISVWREIP